MPKEYSVDDILNEVLGDRAKKSEPIFGLSLEEDVKTAPVEVEEIKVAPVEVEEEIKIAKPKADFFVTSMPEDSAEIDIPILKKRAEKPVIDSTDEPTILHKPEETAPKKEAVVLSEDVKEFVKSEAKKETVHFPIDIPLDDDEPEEENSDEFSNYGQKKEFLNKFSLEKTNATVRVIVSAVCAAVLLALGLWQFLSSGETPVLQPITADTGVYMCATALIMTLFSAIICYPTTFGGLKSFFSFNANSDSLVALLSVVGVLQCGVSLIYPENNIATALTTASVASLCVMFNALGKLVKATNDKKNFEIVSNQNADKSVCEVIGDSRLSFELTSNMDMTSPVITAGHSTNFLSKFIQNTSEETAADKNMRFLAPVVFFGAIAVGVISLILETTTLTTALSAVCASLCLATPMSSALCSILPLAKANRALRKNGGFICSASSVEEVADTNLVYFDSSELFTSDTIHLYVLRTLGDFKIDDCIVDAASITAEAKIPLCNVFLNMVLGDRKLLRKVDSLIYEDDMGLSAWVDGKRVLLGNRELLKTHGIEPPTREFEAKFKVDGREIVYLVNSGEIAAFFVVGYNADEQVADMVQTLSDHKIAILVRNSDSNLTVKKLSYIFDIDMEDIVLVPKTLQTQCDKYTQNTISAPAGAVYSKGTRAFVKTVLAALKVKTAISLSTLLQLGSVILGYAIVCFFAFVSGLGQVTLPAIMAYQLFWLVAIALLPNLSKYK